MATQVNVQHSSQSDAWGTPRHILAAVRDVLGPIDFDPASSPAFNTNVQAATYFTEEQDALTTPWPNTGTIFCNPPGGKVGNASKTALFWELLMQHRQAQAFDQAIFLAFSLEALQTTQGSKQSIGDYCFCVPRKRLAFETPEGIPGKAPSHSNAIVYVAGRINHERLFYSRFSEFGCVID